MEKLNRTQLGNIFRKLGKKFDFDYYSAFQCCNTCFRAELPDNRDYVYLKYCNKGMNYIPLEKFNMRDKWYISYTLLNWKEIFKEFKIEAEKISNSIIKIPQHEDECLIIIRR